MSDDTSALYSVAIGSVLFHALNETYVCSSLNYTLAVNQIPSAMVVIGLGSSILGRNDVAAENNAEQLVQIVDLITTASSGFLECSIGIMRQDTEEELIVFKGTITNASYVYKTSGGTIRAVRIECMNSAARLYTQPMGSYVMASGADIVHDIPARNTGENNGASQIGTYRNVSMTAAQICNKLKDYIDKKDIVTRLAYITGAVVAYSSHTIPAVEPSPDDMLKLFNIPDYFECSYGLAKEVTERNVSTDRQFSQALCNSIMASVNAGSVLDAIIRTATSLDFLMMLVPRFGDDFKMELQPSKAFDTSIVHRLYFSEISSMNSAYAPLSHINDPQVLIVNFDPSLSFGGNGYQNAVGKPTTLFGAFSTDPVVQRWIENRHYSSDRAQYQNIMVDASSHYKKKIMRAPLWLNLAYALNDPGKSRGAVDETNVVESQRVKQKESGSTTEAEEPKAAEYDYEYGKNLADIIAKSMYTMLYGASNTVDIQVLPNMIFGGGGILFEDCLGELVDIVPNNESDQHLAVRGMLSRVSFTYDAGQSASCTYNMTLSRVRARDEKEESIDCPLYKQIYNK